MCVVKPSARKFFVMTRLLAMEPWCKVVEQEFGEECKKFRGTYRYWWGDMLPKHIFKRGQDCANSKCECTFISPLRRKGNDRTR